MCSAGEKKRTRYKWFSLVFSLGVRGLLAWEPSHTHYRQTSVVKMENETDRYNNKSLTWIKDMSNQHVYNIYIYYNVYIIYIYIFLYRLLYSIVYRCIMMHIVNFTATPNSRRHSAASTVANFDTNECHNFKCDWLTSASQKKKCNCKFQFPRALCM